MDPNAALDEIRHLVSKSKVVYLDDHETMRLVELVEGLDNWLSNGGFLPDAWSHAPEMDDTPFEM